MDPVTHSEVPAATAPIAAPVVTVVIQTFNRGSILEYAIGSVLRQIFTDGELLVMGDARIDDSVAVVARCTNPRIRFVNLPERVADQSGPNNERVRRAHRSDADPAFTMQIGADPDGRVQVNACYADGGLRPPAASAIRAPRQQRCHGLALTALWPHVQAVRHCMPACGYG
jgi:glycosyltransferase involved in cell wall biosynthesis